MALFVISYDLIKQKDYPNLTKELERLGAKRVLLSMWLAELDPADPQAILNHFKQYIDTDDRMMVIEFKKKPALTPCLKGTNDWIAKNLP